MTLGTVLLVEDDDALRETLAEVLESKRFEVVSARSAQEAVAVLQARDLDVVLTDVRMPGGDGIALCERIVATYPSVLVIVMTGFGDMNTAVSAMRAGAFDFLSKPMRGETVALAVGQAVHHRRVRDDVRRLRETQENAAKDVTFVFESPAMADAVALARRVARTGTNVLVTGESGSGKEVLARVLHEASGRTGPFIAINCAAMPEALLESELFGHVKGAFTDARETRLGLLREAEGGTLLLDEIGDMPIGLQPKLLRFLQERTVRPVGGKAEIPVDVRIVAATHRDLEACVKGGTFREDLFFRLNVVNVEVPPLRQRRADVLPLAHRFVHAAAERMGKRVSGVTVDAAEKLVAYEWPGNVRELQNCMERAVAITAHDRIVTEDLTDRVRRSGALSIPPAVAEGADLAPLDVVERRYVEHVLALVDGNKSRAAKILGIERKTLYRKLEAWKLLGEGPAGDDER